MLIFFKYFKFEKVWLKRLMGQSQGQVDLVFIEKKSKSKS